MNALLSYETRWGTLEIFNQKPPFEIVELEQIHSCILHHAVPKSHQLAGDGLIFIPNRSSCEITCAIKTADCLPVLIEGEHGWALLHIGWKGLAGKMIQQQAIEALSPSHLWVGPHISFEKYEVQIEFTKNFPQSHNFNEKEGKLYFGLENELLDQCAMFGDLEAMQSTSCTFDTRHWHSFRRDKTHQRNWTIFKPHL